MWAACSLPEEVSGMQIRSCRSRSNVLDPWKAPTWPLLVPDPQEVVSFASMVKIRPWRQLRLWRLFSLALVLVLIGQSCHMRSSYHLAEQPPPELNKDLLYIVQSNQLPASYTFSLCRTRWWILPPIPATPRWQKSTYSQY